MRILRYGSRGSAVELLQLALNRAGFNIAVDGIFGEATRQAVIAFQGENSLSRDGIVGTETHRALLPLYTAYRTVTVMRGDTVWKLARKYGTDENAVLTANPGIDVSNLRIGSQLVIPLAFSPVPTDINWFSGLIAFSVRGLAARYPFLRVSEAGSSVMRKPLWVLTVGSGDTRLMYNAAHHANEWITTPVLLKFLEELCEAYVNGGTIEGQSAAELLSRTTLSLIPAVDPDGIDLVTGELNSGEYYERARKIAADYPRFRFPQDWKANINGIDLNLQYPAQWEQAKLNKEALGIVSPAPADYVGTAPLTAPESRAVYDYTLRLDPALVLAYHTQGEVIYWKYDNYAPAGAAEIVERLSAVSGYAAENTPFASGFAGYKDWFIESLDRPGFTIEAGKGTNPLPVSDFDEIYRRNRPLLVSAMLMA